MWLEKLKRLSLWRCGKCLLESRLVKANGVTEEGCHSSSSLASPSPALKRPGYSFPVEWAESFWKIPRTTCLKPGTFSASDWPSTHSATGPPYKTYALAWLSSCLLLSLSSGGVSKASRTRLFNSSSIWLRIWRLHSSSLSIDNKRADGKLDEGLNPYVRCKDFTPTELHSIAVQSKANRWKV